MAFEGSLIQTIASGVNGILSVENVTYILADGRSVSQTTYPELYAVISGRYGEAGDNFTLPDCRGYYLRGDGLSSGRDPDLSSRTLYGPNATTSGVGTFQPSAGGSHTHSIPAGEVRSPSDNNPSRPRTFRNQETFGTAVTSSGVEQDTFIRPPIASVSGIDITDQSFMNPATYTFYTYIKAT